ncbi:colanic acid/amylovoran biosynthesis protein [Fibrobacter sp. UWH5]|uniref:polysaccharide pyruvyl transferase family protein n=1 Tax=Fibrobacter sp. UWH5 TaxID=1896211 RepID=UPI00091191BC|nr:polysaccharide pyruvyl transferase family protein [Fibrobacter sp. UWH5]SHL04835.1 colanic acid/amylovoran biosynthesis protein [Fibrobacter sp. UWH5]
MQRKVFLIAYAHKNFGDDLFVRLLCERYPHTQFYLEASKSNEALTQIANLILLKESFFQKVLRKIIPLYVPFLSVVKRSYSVVFVGGSMFMERSGWEKRLEQLKRIRKSAKNFCILGSNFGPYSDSRFLESYRNFFHSLEDCCFRDKHSYQLFSENENIRYAFDIAFSVLYEKKIEKTNSVLISVIDPRQKKDICEYELQYFKALVSAVQKYSMEGKKVTLLSFCEEQGDLDVCYRIKKELPSCSDVDVVNYDGCIHMVFDLFARAEIVVASRFHAMIMGFLFDCKVFPIVYNEKLSNVLDDLGFDAECFDLRKIRSICDNNLIEMKNKKLWIERSKNQFVYLDKLLG